EKARQGNSGCGVGVNFQIGSSASKRDQHSLRSVRHIRDRKRRRVSGSRRTLRENQRELGRRNGNCGTDAQFASGREALFSSKGFGGLNTYSARKRRHNPASRWNGQ